ncbi:MAG: transporter substrate-binding domain-containing protein [Candidatus Adiutrix sp.]|jgi:polar amino acid transport system substrate-binding protein|nr:transporter substrate-binding domain-containing protein [Candidatus Adiutrix sp.]
MFKRFMPSLAIVAALIMMGGPALAQTGPAGANPEDAALLAGNPWVEQIKSRGVLRVGFDIFRPWAMETRSGRYVGFEIQVAEALAADLGVEAEFVPTAWDGIIPALLTGRFDIIIGSLGITEERRQKVVFTDPYSFSGMAIAASRRSAPNKTSLADFNRPEIVVAAKSGTTAAIAARELLPQATLKTFDSEDQTAQELRSGKAQALIASAPYPAELALKSPGEIYVPVSGTLTSEPCGMALSPKNREALPALNAWIAARFKTRWLEKTWSYWFETLDWEGLLK